MKTYLHSIKSFAILIVLLLSITVNGQTNTWNGSSGQNWNTPANWSQGHVPLSTENVVIANVPNKPIISGAGAVCATLQIASGNGSNILTINSPGTLLVSGTITMISPTNNTNNTIINVFSGTLTAGSITMNNSTSNSRDASLRIGTGSVSIKGNIAMSGTAQNNDITFTGAGTLNIEGTITGGTLTPLTGTVNYNNIGNQDIGRYTYNNLTLSGSGTKRFQIITTIGGDLAINTGVIADLGTGLIHTTNSLSLATVSKSLCLSWGSTPSSAINKDDVFFAATTGYIRGNPLNAPNISFDQGSDLNTVNTTICGIIGGGGQNDIDIRSGDNGTRQWEYSMTNTTGSWIVDSGTGSQFQVSSFATTPGTYYFRLRITSASCSVYSDVITLVVTGTPRPSPTTTGASRCGTGSITISASSTLTNPTLRWYTTPFGGTPVNNTPSYTIPSLSATTTYYVSAANSTCESPRSPVTATINTVPSAPIVGAITQPNCTTTTGSVELSGLPATGTWNLYQNGNTTPIQANRTGTTTTVSGLLIGIHNFSVSNGSCTSPLSANVPINSAVTNIWNGTAWSNVTPPDINQAVVFNGNYTLNTDIEGCSCTINSGTVIIPDGKTMTITNGVHINGGSMTFENNASLVQTNEVDTNSGIITYKRISSFMKDFDYTYWSSPVQLQNTFNLSPNTQYDKFYYFENNGWKDAKLTLMEPGRGYIIRTPKAGNWPAPYPEVVSFPYAQPVQFIGKPNNGNQITFTIDPIAGRKNLIGNPYPSAMDANAFLLANQNVLEGTIFFWTHNTAIQLAANITNGTAGSGVYAYTSDDYSAYNSLGGVGGTPSPSNPTGSRPSGKIAAGQSFMAVTKATAPVPGIVHFSNAMRVKGENTQFFKINKNAKTTTSGRQRVWLNLTNTEGAFKQTLIGYISGATNGYEDLYDGIINNANSFINFYSVNEDKKLVIQGRALPFEQTDIVPLGYSSGSDGSFAINIDTVDGDLTDQTIFIEDKETKTVHNLKTGPYKFSTLKGTFNERLLLRYTDKTLGTDDLKLVENTVVVTVKNKQLQIHSSLETIDKVLIYDLLGKKIFEKDAINEKEFRVLNLSIKQQLLLVKTALLNGGVVTTKVLY